MQAYKFTSPPILHALVSAHRRGVDVHIILDRVNATDGAEFVSDAGIAMWIDDQQAIADSKIAIVDQEMVITGSFNLTRSAETRNVESDPGGSNASYPPCRCRCCTRGRNLRDAEVRLISPLVNRAVGAN